jgi:hypothetical protein
MPAEGRQSDAGDEAHTTQLVTGGLAYFAGSSSET